MNEGNFRNLLYPIIGGFFATSLPLHLLVKYRLLFFYLKIYTLLVCIYQILDSEYGIFIVPDFRQYKLHPWSTRMHVSTSTCLCSHFKRLLHTGGVDIIQPDLSHAGGITEVRKIGAMAEAYDVALAPHCPLGPIALAACLQVDTCSYNGVIQEQSMGIHYNVGKSVLDYVNNKEDFTFVNGYAKQPTLPGLGVDVCTELVEEENK